MKESSPAPGAPGATVPGIPPDRAPSSPLRGLPAPVSDDGCRMLSASTVGHRDGAEEALLGVVLGASDLDSLSDELASAARASGGWVQEYHLPRERANLLRPLVIDSLAVLEIGAGCGAVTRYLGERCALVDALEPMPERARVARARTRDLPTVEVFVGELRDVPVEPVYDLVTLVGVLEYVCAGSGDPGAYAAYLRRVGALLRPGGTVLVAIENRLGVKYPAGSPEDHVLRPYEGLEDYPHGAAAHTFGRAELAAAFRGAGMACRFLHAFPYYKLPRFVFSDALLEPPVLRRLAWDVPRFPSPGRGGAVVRGPDEARLWRALVENGLGGHFPNSFLALAWQEGGRRTTLWPPGLAGALYGTDRRPRFATATRITCARGSARFARECLAPEPDTPEDVWSVRVAPSAVVEGEPLLDRLAASQPGPLAVWMRGWRELVTASCAGAADGAAAVHVLPRDVIVVPGGDLVATGLQWIRAGGSVEDVLRRGCLLAAAELAHRVVPERLAALMGAATVGEVAAWLGAAVGLDPRGGWLEAAVAAEAEFRAQLHECGPGAPGWAEAVSRAAAEVRGLVACGLRHLPPGDREHELRAGLEREVAALRERCAGLEAAAAADARPPTHRQVQEAVRRLLSNLPGRSGRPGSAG